MKDNQDISFLTKEKKSALNCYIIFQDLVIEQQYLLTYLIFCQHLKSNRTGNIITLDNYIARNDKIMSLYKDLLY